MRIRTEIDHSVPVKQAKADPGVWKFAGVYRSPAGAAAAAIRVRKADKMPSYGPAGAFEAYAARHEDDGTALWVRYVVGVKNLMPRPKTMTYRVCDRGSGPGYEGVRIETVTVSSSCVRCGGPRGAATHHRFCEDGEWYTVSQWDNACGHVDMYEAVLAEHRARLLAMQTAQERAELRAVLVGSDDEQLKKILEGRPVHRVAQPRVELSSNPIGFEACMHRTVAALGRGEDLATAAWTADDPVALAAEIEVLAGRRRLALASARKDSK